MANWVYFKAGFLTQTAHHQIGGFSSSFWTQPPHLVWGFFRSKKVSEPTLTELSRTEAQVLQSFIAQVDFWKNQHGDKASTIEIT